MSSKAIVYVLHRQGGSSHKLAKVGSTKISAESRAANYTDGGWASFYTAEVSAHIRYAVEKEAHNILKQGGHWLDPAITGGTANEIFTCSPHEAKIAVERAIHIVKRDLKSFIDPEYDAEMQKLKLDNATFSNEIGALKRQSQEIERYKDAQRVVNEAEHVKKLQERIRILDKTLIERDQQIKKLGSDLRNLSRTVELDSRRKFRKKG